MKYVKCIDLIDVRDGTHDSPKYINNGGYPLITSKNIKNNTIDFENVNYISEEDYIKINKRSGVSNGDVIMPMIGTVGNPVIINTNKDFAIKNVALFKLSNNDNVNSKFFYYCLKSDRVINQLSKNKRGGTQRFVSLSNLRNLEIPYINIDKQLKIVEVLDKATELIEKRTEQIQELDNLIKSKFIELFADPIKNPKNFSVKRLSDIAEYFIGLTYKPEDVCENGTLVLRSGNIQNSKLVFDDNVRVNKAVKDKFFVKENDILMCSRNGSEKLVGKVAMIPKLNEEVTFGAFMTVIRSTNYYYLFTYFQLESFRQQLKSAKTTTINQITKKMLDDIKIPVPPMELQNEFAEYVKQIEKLKSDMQLSLIELENNYNSLMQRAFKGELFI